jgi:hypothetical protein
MFLFPGGSTVSAAVATVEFRGSSVDATNGTVFTFSAEDLGSSADAHKVVIVIETPGTTRTISSVTVDGNAAVLVVQTASNQESFIYDADGITATSGDVVVTFTSSASRCGIGVYAVYGSATADSDNGSSLTDPGSVTIDVLAGGVVIGGASLSTGSPSSYVWTELIEHYDEIVESESIQSGASKAYAAAQTDLVITSDCDSSVNQMVVATWGPV